MPCPHSSSPTATPDACSMCKQAAPRIVTRDEATGAMLVDGKPPKEPRGFIPQSYGRNGPKKKGGRPRRNVQPTIIEPEPVDDLD